MTLDQFYTCPNLAKGYAAQVMARWADPDVLFVEPSAGTGAFLHPLRDAGRKVRAVDIDPACQGVDRTDFLQTRRIFAGDHPAVVTIGNPPFGKNASLAVRFFNHAAAHSDEIAFVVPRTFRKISLQARLHRKFHLTHDKDVGQHAFLRGGVPYDVPCAWQIWTRHKADRPAWEPPCIDHLVRFTPPDQASFAMRRVGYYAGRILTEHLRNLSVTTHYFMREEVAGVIDTLRKVDWSEVASRTVGTRSLSKSEIAFKLSEMYNA
ncbi:MAG: SAM-dependent methyltransferase [Rhodobacteraceae bacterium]|nr:SAM-dependent methyltransferase [Paracoccaceae bacterium]